MVKFIELLERQPFTGIYDEAKKASDNFETADKYLDDSLKNLNHHLLNYEEMMGKVRNELIEEKRQIGENALALDKTKDNIRDTKDRWVWLFDVDRDYWKFYVFLWMMNQKYLKDFREVILILA